MKKLFFVLLLTAFVAVSCADYRLLKDYYGTPDAPKEVVVIPTFPSTLEEGAVPDILTLKVVIRNESTEPISLDPGKIYISVGTAMHAPLSPEVIAGQNKKADITALALKRTTLNPGQSAQGTLYFPKAVASAVEARGFFNLNIDAGLGKKIIVVYKK
jgi:hypothetical protein